MRNIEVKAALKNPAEAHTRAKELSGDESKIILQKDTFFKTERGRLKLRTFQDGSGELIYYERPNTQGPKLSDYVKTDLPSETSCEQMKSILTKANGILGVVEKTRNLYIVGQSRVHVDKVTDLGDFLEIEVVLDDSQELEDGKGICNDLITKLGISEDDLLSTAYIDLLQEKKLKTE